MTCLRSIAVAFLIALLAISVRADQGPGGGNGGGNGNGSHSVPPMQTVQLAFLLLGSILRDALRESDLVTFDPLGYQYIVLLAHSSKTEASRAVRRVQDLIVERSALHCRVGLAEFPTDGFTIADLVTKAREECQLPLSSTNGSWRE